MSELRQHGGISMEQSTHSALQALQPLQLLLQLSLLAFDVDCGDDYVGDVDYVGFS